MREPIKSSLCKLFLAYHEVFIAVTSSGKILHEIEKQASKRWLPIIGYKKAQIIADVVEEKKPHCSLEVGTNVGYSAIVIASHMPLDSCLITIEVNRDLAIEAEANIKKAGLSDRVKVLTGDALKLIPEIKSPIDFAFLDAEKDEYIRYLELIEPKLIPGSVVVADNVGAFPRAMAEYLERVRHSGLYESQYVSVGWDGIEVSRRL